MSTNDVNVVSMLLRRRNLDMILFLGTNSVSLFQRLKATCIKLPLTYYIAYIYLHFIYIYLHYSVIKLMYSIFFLPQYIFRYHCSFFFFHFLLLLLLPLFFFFLRAVNMATRRLCWQLSCGVKSNGGYNCPTRSSCNND